MLIVTMMRRRCKNNWAAKLLKWQADEDGLLRLTLLSLVILAINGLQMVFMSAVAAKANASYLATASVVIATFGKCLDRSCVNRIFLCKCA